MDVHCSRWMSSVDLSEIVRERILDVATIKLETKELESLVSARFKQTGNQHTITHIQVKR